MHVRSMEHRMWVRPKYRPAPRLPLPRRAWRERTTLSAYIFLSSSLPTRLLISLSDITTPLYKSQIGGGVLGDVWRTEERGQAIALYSLAPLLGPVIGPLAGAWIAQGTTWRWVFWSTSIANCVVQALGFVYLRESELHVSVSFSYFVMN